MSDQSRPDSTSATGPQPPEWSGDGEGGFRALADDAPVPLWLNGPEGCAFVNRACRDFLGLNLQTDTRGFDWARYVHPEDREAYVAACRDAERRRAPFPGEFRFRRHDGEYRWMRSVFTPRVTTAGQFLGYIGCMLDIHEERAVAAALRDSETRLAAELADARLLQEVSVRLVAEGDVAALYDQIRDAAAALMQSDAASMQALDPATGDLRLLTWTGFAPESAAFWDRVRPDSGSTCGAALARGERVVVPDVEACDFMAGTQDLAEYRRSSLRAVQSTPLRTRDGRLLGMISTHWRRPREPSGRELRRLDVLARQAADLLERRLAEDALRQSERRLRLALSAARSGIWTLDLNTGAQTRGQNLNRLLGLESVETTQPFEEFLTHIQPDDRPRVREAFATSMREGSPLNIEFRVVLPGGEVRWLRDQGDVFGDAAAGARHMAGVCIDVTVLKEADARLRASEGRFRQILASATDFAIFTFDADRRVTGWSPGAAAVFGYPEARMLGRLSDEVFTPEDRAAAVPEREAEQARRQGRAADERWHVREGGERFYASGVLTPLGDGGFVKVLRDLTERKRLEDELRDADRRKDEFLAMLGHELRNPLAPLRCLAEVLRRQELAGGALERAHAMLERQVGHLTRLVDDLLDVSRITRGQVELRKEPVNLGDVAGQAVEMATAAIEGRGHELSLTLPRKPLRVEGDPTRLTQVVFNLLGNAAKYTDPGGKIGLAVEREGGEAVLRVRDNGSGMKPALMAKVFDLFTQGERALDRSQGGLGLGLTLVKRLVEMHGGVVEARSQGPGKGSEFTVRLPALSAEAEEPHTRPQGRPRATVQVGRALVIDDNFDVAESTTCMLEGLASEIRMVHSGAAALETAPEFRPDVILCDIGMPRMDGYETCRRLRQVPGLEKVIIAAVSGYGGPEDRKRSQEAGFDRHLVKPIGRDAVEELVRSAAQGR